MWEIQKVLSRMWTDLLARPSGPFAFRFLLQPLIAATFAIRDGIKDAHTGRSPYVWAILCDAAERRALLGEGLKATGRIIAFGIGIDVIYQLKALGAVYPIESLAIALLLGFVPYLLMRGVADRAARRWRSDRTPQQKRLNPESDGPIT
jgi:hypothetical protein